MIKINDRQVARTFNGLVQELFNDLEQNLAPLTSNTTGRQAAPVNIVENKEGYHMELLAPGRNKEGFNLKVEKQQLTISYKAPEAPAQTEDVKTLRREFVTGEFSRVFNLDDTINTDGIMARYEDGLLKVFLPRKEELKPAVREITLQ